MARATSPRLATTMTVTVGVPSATALASFARSEPRSLSPLAALTVPWAVGSTGAAVAAVVRPTLPAVSRPATVTRPSARRPARDVRADKVEPSGSGDVGPWPTETFGPDRHNLSRLDPDW